MPLNKVGGLLAVLLSNQNDLSGLLADLVLQELLCQLRAYTRWVTGEKGNRRQIHGWPDFLVTSFGSVES